MQRAMRFRSLIVWLLLLGAALGAVWYRQDLIDWWRLRGYSAPQEVQRLAEAGTVTDLGRKVFYVAHPLVEEKGSFNQHCNQRTEKTIILGCYDGRYIYVYNVSDQRLSGVKEVTAMHEMLHAAYDRLSHQERETINQELRAQLNVLNDARINELITHYEEAEPGQVDNELHSILGTEVPNLGPQLEKYYQRYFRNRATVVAFAQRYEGVFTQSEKDIATLDVQLGALRKSIEANEAQLTSQRTQLDQEYEQLQSLRSQGSIAAYNTAVGPYNANVARFNNLLAATKQLISNHNNLVATRNQLATAHNDLAQSLDSNLTPLPAK